MPKWLLLAHNIPPRPLYLRAKIRQRLAQVGAIPLKNSVYLLPRSSESLEDLQWVGQEIISGGGQAHILAADFVTPAESDALVSQFLAARGADYDALTATARALLKSRAGATEATDFAAQQARLIKKLGETDAIDFFHSPRRGVAARAFKALETRGKTNRKEDRRMQKSQPGLRGKTWATRPGIKIDRIASAWFVRRFIDSKARFRFVDPATPATPGEIRFDMVGGDFTHDGDRCTFETLVRRVGTADRGVKAIAEIVHDLDLKDGKFGRSEASGVQKMIEGLTARYEKDVDRMERGFALFDDLHQALQTPEPRRKKTR